MASTEETEEGGKECLDTDLGCHIIERLSNTMFIGYMRVSKIRWFADH
jgi:hypothetical protein